MFFSAGLRYTHIREKYIPFIRPHPGICISIRRHYDKADSRKVILAFQKFPSLFPSIHDPDFQATNQAKR